MPNYFLLGALLSIFLYCNSQVAAQSTYIPLGNDAYPTLNRLEMVMGEFSPYLHTAIKPYNRLAGVQTAELAEDYTGYLTRTDRLRQYYVYNSNTEWSNNGLIPSKKPFLGLYKYKTNAWFYQDNERALIIVDPVLHAEIGSDAEHSDIRFVNTRGLRARGWISETLGFSVFVSENQAAYPGYVQNYIRQYGAVPGEGRYKTFVSDVSDKFATGTDYFDTRGYITFQAIKNIRLQFGHDKNFIGDGTRSLLLSDFANDYLFLKLNTHIGKFNYQNLFAELISQYQGQGDQDLARKYTAMHHLSINLSSRLNIGLFEAVVFDRPNGFDLQYLNPIIFYRAIESSLGSADNVLLGLNFKWLTGKSGKIYGQVVVDEFRASEIFSDKGWWANKYGMQLGWQQANLFKAAQLDAGAELNIVRPFTYTHQAASGNYTHYNLPLAHPLGANFVELNGYLNYRSFKKVNYRLEAMYYQQGAAATDSVNIGTNIFMSNLNRSSDYGYKLLGNHQNEVLMLKGIISYQIKHNLWLDAIYTYRNANEYVSNPRINPNSNYIGLAIRINAYRKTLLF